MPISKRKMGQTASAELAELTGCVIDPPQNVSKKSEQKEAEMLPERVALRLKETSQMPSNGEEESFLKELAESMEKIIKEQPESRERVVSYRGNVRVDTASKRNGRGRECCPECS